MLRKFSCLLLATLTSVAFAQKFDGLVPTPPMGWNTWNTFAANINEVLIKETADEMVRNGMRDAGYTYIVLDDTWSAMERDAQGNLQAHPEKFPSGMKALGDYLHGKGFKFGIYNCAGRKTCAGFPGGWGHEYQDALKYAEWGVDYLKYDWCNSGDANPKDAYTRMRDALFAARRPIVFSICEWGQSKPWEWAKDVGNLWRTTGDIMDCFDCQQQWSRGWKVILDLQMSLDPDHGFDGLAEYAGPGHWNDPDMLEVGNAGLSVAESRAHFTLWCMLAAPLMAGNDVRHMTPEITAILTNRDVIAIDQDPLGRQGYRFRHEPDREIWVKPLAGGDWAICLFNTGESAADIAIDFPSMWQLGGAFAVHDVWDNKDVGTTGKAFSKRIEPHDVALLRLKKINQ